MTDTHGHGAAEELSEDVAQPAVIGAAALVAGSLLWTLTRLRARQLRRRRPGRDLPLPAPDLQQTERRLRAAAADAPLEWIDGVLRLLTVRLRSHPEGRRPELLCVRAGGLGVEVLLAQPDHDAPEGFLSTDGGYTWQLDPALTLDDLRQSAADAAPLAPALVTLGDTPEGPLLVNLEYLPVLGVEGPDEQVQAFVSGLTVELTTAPWASGVTVYPVTDPDDPLARLPGARPVGSLGELAAQMSALTKANRSAIGAADSTLDARLAPDGEDWPPVVVVVREPQAHAQQAVDDLGNTAHSPGSGLVLVVAGSIETATWRLQLTDDGTGTLEPLGLRVTAAGLDGPATAAAAGLLDLATGEDIARPTPLLPPHQRTEVDGDAEEPMLQLDPFPVEVAVLGEVTVTGWASPEVRPKSAEIVAYLAVQARPVPTDKLRTALWPDGINYNSFKTSISRTRRALGVDAEEALHLPEAKDGRYRLGPGVGCDWTRFQALVQSTRTSPTPLALPRLRAALSLVNGPPFDGAAASTYQWAFDEQIVSAIEVAVVDAACRLAELALDADDVDLAIWATRQGHLVTPGHEGLFRARMHAHAHTGDLDGVHQAFRETQRAAQALDPLDDVQPETQQLYQQLTRRPHAARRA